ncbi:hypothetical protein RRG08_054067 [Elysia crispata]|uniref:Uncharacterized protein n=1 Tax=Elysia crispata TaxID=231223 RepID=A0AAE0ZCQ6_9GAST|nr:hypothetical protein RRG08_054067 [Elysia crispata]
MLDRAPGRECFVKDNHHRPGTCKLALTACWTGTTVSIEEQMTSNAHDEGSNQIAGCVFSVSENKAWSPMVTQLHSS